MNRTNTTAFVALATVVIAGAGAISPSSVLVDVPRVSGGGLTTPLSRTDTATFSITIDPWRATTYDLGAGNAIEFPAGSVCDPDKSTYGAAEWDKRCVAARRPVTVHIKAWLDASGHPSIDFHPNIRFVPSALPGGWVNLTFADRRAAFDPAFDILSCRTVGGDCNRESKRDSTLTTRRNAVTGTVTRRIKHFSGYSVAAGRAGDEHVR
jgi:hypothetical protein